MLKALLIDDVMYVRRRMRTIVDWAAYGIEIVAEPENGRAALSYMAAHPVDIIFTDLEMPGLSGMAFLREVRGAFPKVHIVVLTMHQEFELIQQAMRLGVDDYIAKTQIQEDTFGTLLTEVLGRMHALPARQRVTAESVLCLYDKDTGASSEPERRLSEAFSFARADAPIPEGAIAIRVHGLSGETYRQLVDILKAYVRTALFFQYVPGQSLYVCDAKAMQGPPDKNSLTMRLLEQRMLAASWLLEPSIFAQVLALVPTLGLDRETMVAFFFQPLLRCAQYIDLSAAAYFEQATQLCWWFEWRQWLIALQGRVAGHMSAENATLHGIDKAILYIDTHFRENIPQQKVLRIAALSKSHFSALFKARTGMTFVDYIKSRRIALSKVYLLETGWPVAQVAMQSGYADEKYFRRVFIDFEGVSPAQFRRAADNNRHK